jgi:hypothetical protein
VNDQDSSRPGGFHGPWRSEDLLRLFTAMVFGFALIAVSWTKAHDEKLFHSQYSWVALATVGAIAIFSANVACLLRARRRIGERSRSVLAHFDQAFMANVTIASSKGFDHGVADLVTFRGATYFHHPSCPMVTGRELVAAPRLDHESAGLAPCGVCLA